MKIYNFLFLALFMISIVSANGLIIVGENSFNAEKNEDVNTEFRIVIQNQESFTFYNITLEGEGIAQMQGIPVLNSGESANITVVLDGNDNFNGTLNVIGEYEANLGASNQTEIIEVNYDTGVNKCDLSLIRGDSITWTNTGLDEIRLKDITSGEYFATIQDGENYTRHFTEPIVLEYVAVWLVPFTDVCKVEVLNDEGLIHNSEYDASISLNLSILYKQTELKTTFLSTSYSLDYNQIKTNEYFSIENNGNRTARIKISSDWITFDNNELELGAGDSINIGYEITPIITETSATNKTYLKTIKIEGNFPTIENNLSIYIKHSNLDDIIGDTDINYDFFINTFKLLCLKYEETGDEKLREICERNVNSYNGSSSTFEMTQESFHLFLEKYGDDLIENGQYRKDDTEFKANFSDRLEKIDSRISGVENSTTESNENAKNSSAINILSIILICGVISITIAWILIIKKKKQSRIGKDLGIVKGEKYGR